MSEKAVAKLKDYSEEVATLIPEYAEQVAKDVSNQQYTPHTYHPATLSKLRTIPCLSLTCCDLGLMCLYAVR